MLKIDNLHAEIDGKAILNGLTLTVPAGEVHAIMGPNGAGKSTLAYVLGGRPGYEVTQGSVEFNGVDLLDLEPHERAAAGLFLGFQYPVEIPGVSNLQFLREALNAQRRARGEEALTGGEFLKLAEAKAQATMLRVFVDDCLEKVMRGELAPDVAAMAKLLGSEMQGKLLDEFLQLHGGYGFMSEYKISRAWVDARVARIYGGTSEIMKEIIGRAL